MPIVTINTVSKEISSLTFNANDILIVNLISTASDGVISSEQHTLQATTVAELLDTPPPVGYTMRQAIISKVYTALLELGMVQGTIEAA